MTFLPHHHDRPSNQQKPGSIKPKPFVLVTLLTPAAAQKVTADWPWLPRRTAPPQGHDEVKEVMEGARFGLRALTKAQWEEMKEEYLEYRRQLLGEANGMDGRTNAASQISPTHPHQQELARSEAAVCDEVRDDSSAPPPTHISPNAPYPPGCLLFVRNVHAETNKTTLKALLAAHAPTAARGVDYVDYNKGMISVSIRLPSLVLRIPILTNISTVSHPRLLPCARACPHRRLFYPSNRPAVRSRRRGCVTDIWQRW